MRVVGVKLQKFSHQAVGADEFSVSIPGRFTPGDETLSCR